ncbi:hypothetical protein M8494_11625 [Serratia ureilytica]
MHTRIHPDGEERFNWNAHGQLAEHQGRAGQPDPLAVQRPGAAGQHHRPHHRTRRYHWLRRRGRLTRLERRQRRRIPLQHDAVGRVLAEERGRHRHYYRYGAARLLEEHREVGPLPGSAGETQANSASVSTRPGRLGLARQRQRGNGITASTPWGRLRELNRLPTAARRGAGH